MISNKNTTIEILNRYGLFAKKKFGQNFLIDNNIVKKIVSTANIDKETGVIEIGPGIGAMTEILAMNAGKVLCYEIDEDMVKILSEVITNDNVKVIHNDFLKVNILEDISYFEGLKRIVVVSNLPYYITTPIIFKLLDHSDVISSMYFMVQKEVCTRLTACEGNKDYGSLSVLIKLNGIAKQEFIVTRNCFYPAPNVDSAIASIVINKDDCSLKNDPNFLKFVHNIFEQKRKTLYNNISSKYDVSKEKVYEVFKEIGLEESIRAEKLSLEKIIKIYEMLIK